MVGPKSKRIARIRGEEVRLTDLNYEDWLEHAFGPRLVESGTGCCGGIPDAFVRAPGADVALVFG